MGNGSSSSGNDRHRRADVFTAAAPYPDPQHYFPYAGYYHPHPPTHHGLLPAPIDPHNRLRRVERAPLGLLPPVVEYQKALTIRNDINLRKETLRIEPDEENPGDYLVAFKFDATVAGSITIIFFAKEGVGCNLMPMKEGLKPTTMSFKKGLGQTFRQPSGMGINFSQFKESELQKEDMEVYPLTVRAEASICHDMESADGNLKPRDNSQITLATFEVEGEEYNVKVVKQILWVDGNRYELQEIYGIGNSVNSNFDDNDTGKECVVCLSEPRDTTALPCRHMCMCSECANALLTFRSNKCPICRQPIQRLLEIKVNDKLEG